MQNDISSIIKELKSDSKIFLFGAGLIGIQTAYLLINNNIALSNLCFVDNFKFQDSNFIEIDSKNSIPVISQSHMAQEATSNDIIIITTKLDSSLVILEDLKQITSLKSTQIYCVSDIVSNETLDNSFAYKFTDSKFNYDTNFQDNIQVCINCSNKFTQGKLSRTINSLIKLKYKTFLIVNNGYDINLELLQSLKIKFNIISTDQILFNHYELLDLFTFNKHLFLKNKYILFMNVGDTLSDSSTHHIEKHINANMNMKFFLCNRDLFFNDKYISPLYRSKISNFSILENTMFNDFLLLNVDNLNHLKNKILSQNDIFIIPEFIYHLDYDNIDKRFIKTIPYYLTQFHTTTENDNWWGKGFTEWTNTKKAVPLFEGHYQPHEPHDDIGYYDLMNDSFIQQKQIDIAKKYGLSGFCYYYYHFSKRRMLEKPFNKMIENKNLDFPFCIFWANEDWTRSWEGKEKEILIPQVCDETACMDFIDEVIPLFKDSRYITVNGKPLLIVYRALNIANFHYISMLWRNRCIEAGLKGLHIVIIGINTYDPRVYNSDAISDFPIINSIVSSDNISYNNKNLIDNFNGKIYNYDIFSKIFSDKHEKDFITYPCTTIGFDNTARKNLNATIFDKNTISSYQDFLATNIDYITTFNDKENQINFIFAWNEWAEGAHLEPDKKHGYDFLKATYDVIFEKK